MGGQKIFSSLRSQNLSPPLSKRGAAAASVCPHVCLGRTCIVIIRSLSADLSVRFRSSIFRSPWQQSMSTYSQPSFSSSIWKRGGVWIRKLGVISQERLKIDVKLLLSANKKSYMPRRLAQKLMTFSDLKCSFHVSRTISAVAWLLVFRNALTSRTWYKTKM